MNAVLVVLRFWVWLRLPDVVYIPMHATTKKVIAPHFVSKLSEWNFLIFLFLLSNFFSICQIFL
jgi:hypothetical protein